MKILLIFPTPYEACAFFKKAGCRAKLGAEASLEISGSEFAAIVSGIGCAASAERVEKFAKSQNFDMCILCGFCGSCSENIKEGDFLFEARDAEFSSILEGLNFKRGKFACAEKIADSGKKRELGEAGFAGVEMESGFFCGLFPPEKFAHLRAVSDGLRSKIPAEFFDSMLDRSSGASSFSFSKFFKIWAKNPLLPARLIGFAVSAGMAKKSYEAKLAQALEKIADFYLQKGGKNGTL
ncbi:MAG: hypothetical protein J6T16_02590 [Opitutales bacterium]|nr:hypothetical protein [Opitutales bacterium]